MEILGLSQCAIQCTLKDIAYQLPQMVETHGCMEGWSGVWIRTCENLYISMVSNQNHMIIPLLDNLVSDLPFIR